ncbi:MAG: RsmE family RNA methyltransferase [Phycisphaerales bacterium]
MSVHRVFHPEPLPDPGATLVVKGDEARHAAVKRVEPGEGVEVLDGTGGIAYGRVLACDGGKQASLTIVIDSVARRDPVRPALHAWSATPKRDRADQLIDQLSQIGAASWSPLATRRGVVDPRDTKLERLQRVAVESMKQCGRAHLLQIKPSRSLDDLLRWLGHGSGRAAYCADATGGSPGHTTAGELVLIIGPEGGWEPDELELLRAAGVQTIRLGPHVLRIETAAAIGASTLLSLFS